MNNTSKLISNVIDNEKISELWNLVDLSDNIVITSHLSPDGDALGSSLALSQHLLKKGKNTSIIVPNSFPYFLNWMKGAEDIIIYETNTEKATQLIDNADIIFSLDYNVLKRVGRIEPLIKSSKAKKILIDHHLFPEHDFDIIISHPEASSTSELIFRLFYQSQKYELLDIHESESIYCGIMTDTGAFTYNSSNPEIYEIVSLLIRKGVNKDLIYNKVYNNFTEDRFRLLGYTLFERMHINLELKSALIHLSLEDQLKFSLNKGDTEGFANIPLSIKGIYFSTFIREHKDLIKISFRSQGNFPCNQFASEFFDGGGHLNASGAEFHGSLEDAISVYNNGLKKYSDILKNCKC